MDHLNDVHVQWGVIDMVTVKEISNALSHTWHCMQESDFLRWLFLKGVENLARERSTDH